MRQIAVMRGNGLKYFNTRIPNKRLSGRPHGMQLCFLQSYLKLFMSLLYPFPNGKILNSSKLKEFGDDNFKFVENDRKLFKQVEKHSGKKRKCSLRAFLSFSHSVFKRLVLQTCKNQGLFGKGLTKRSNSGLIHIQEFEDGIFKNILAMKKIEIRNKNFQLLYTLQYGFQIFK